MAAGCLDLEPEAALGRAENEGSQAAYLARLSGHPSSSAGFRGCQLASDSSCFELASRSLAEANNEQQLAA